MTDTTASIGFGCTFQRSDGATPTPAYTDIGEVIDPGAFSMTRDTVDATHTGSTNRFREFIGGLRDGGEFSPVLALNPGNAAHDALIADIKLNTAVGYRFAFNDALSHRWTFSGFITSLAQTTPIDDRMTVAVTVKVTGEPVLSSN